MNQDNMFRFLMGWVDEYFGRGSYDWIRPWLAPYQEDTHLAYARTLSRLVQPGIRWLDAGCGHKILARNLEKDEKEIAGRTCHAVGCDTFVPSQQQHRSLENIVSCDINSLPFCDGSFDLVTLNMVAEHLREPERAFSELARVLDRGGQLVIHTPCASSYEIWIIRLGWRIAPRKAGHWMIRFLEGRDPGEVFPTFYRANTRSQLSRLMKESGLFEEELRVIEGRPFFYFAAPLSILEIVLERFLRAIGKNEVCPATFQGIYRRSGNRRPAPDPADMACHSGRGIGARIRQQLFDILACPVCKTLVRLTPEANAVRCATCHRVYPVLNGIPHMLDKLAVFSSNMHMARAAHSALCL
jgi:LSD1 subclass zinc finger protein